MRRCEAAGVLVDLAHINRQGFLDACSVATKPPIVSHTGVLGAFEHWRNIDDEQLRAVADKGGVVGVIFYPRYLGGDGLEPVVKHMLHILDVVGEDVPALGSDWDGFIVPTRELADPRGLPLLTDALLGAGVTERVIGKILRRQRPSRAGLTFLGASPPSDVVAALTRRRRRSHRVPARRVAWRSARANLRHRSPVVRGARRAPVPLRRGRATCRRTARRRPARV